MIAAVALLHGCAKSRQYYQQQADTEVHQEISERNGDPRWHVPDFDIRMNPTSRFFEPYNQNFPPSPSDDPASHRYMHCVDGMEGWKHWRDYGIRSSLENPGWRSSLSQYGTVDELGNITIDIDSAIRMAYVESPQNQTQLETLYLSALELTKERFRLDTQYFGGLDAIYRHNGNVVPASIQYDAGAGRYIVSPPSAGLESNRLTLGTGGSPFQARRRYATAGELLGGFANAFVVEFTGSDVSLPNSLANFTLLQPLLRGAGRDIALEQLTFAERNLLSNLRAYSQYRQGFYTLIAVGDLGVSGPVLNSRTTNLNIFSGLAGVDGYVGLLQQQQQIRNAENNLKLQLRSLKRLEAFLDGGLIDLVQVEQFRQTIENDRVNLLRLRNTYLRTFDNYKRKTLGLPPDVPLELDDTLIQQFRLVATEGTSLQDKIAAQQQVMGEVDQDISADQLQSMVDAIGEIAKELKDLVAAAQQNVDAMKKKLAMRFETMNDEDRERLETDVASLDQDATRLSSELLNQQTKVTELTQKLESEQETKKSDLREEATDLMAALKRLTQNTILVQARARLESVSIDPINMTPEFAMEVALANRLDFMNGRAALVDNWRLIAVSADALQSVLNIVASGDVATDRDDPLSFRGGTGNLRLGLEFDAPFTRLIERNAYRQSLINYQRSRRGLIQSHDALQVDLRVLLREIKQLEENLEIQRRSVAIAIRRVDLTQSKLEAPSRPAQPGQRPAQLGPTAAINLISAQAALRDTQNEFLKTWLSYYAARMRLARELGIMEIDNEGIWVENPLPLQTISPEDNALLESERLDLSDDASQTIPPALPDGILPLIESLPENFEFPITDPAPLTPPPPDTP